MFGRIGGTDAPAAGQGRRGPRPSSRTRGSCPQCKWGRPEGRPHSHRCVDPRRDTWHPVSLPLGHRSFDWALRRCHRRSHRHPVPSGGWSGPEGPFRPPGGSETGLPWWPFASNGCALRPKPSNAPSAPGRKSGRWRRCFAFLSNDLPCVGPKPSAWPVSKTARTDAATPIRFEIFSSFKSLDLSVPKVPRRLDGLKLPLRSESRKLASPRLSTFPRFRCGRGWITQRFVANALE